MSDRPQLVLRRLPKTLDARHFNRVRLALARLGSPLRVAVPEPGLKEMILRREEWLCVDCPRGELPLLAFTDFQVSGRTALHAPVHCTVEIYHIHAGILLGSILERLTGALEERLAS